MTTTMLSSYRDNSKAIYDLNHALQLLNTTTDEFRLQSITKHTFKRPLQFVCELTDDASLLHQYRLLLDRQQGGDIATTSKILGVHSGRQYFAGAEIFAFDALPALPALRHYGVGIEDAGFAHNALFVGNVILEDIHVQTVATLLLSALIQEAKAQQLTSIVITGDTVPLNALHKVATLMVDHHTVIHASMFGLDDMFDMSIYFASPGHGFQLKLLVWLSIKAWYTKAIN